MKRTLRTRIKEDAEKALASRPYTRNNRKTLEKEEFVDRESDWRTRGIKEAIWIRKTKDSMNRDEGQYRLSHIYDDLLKGQPGRGRGGHTSE